MSGAADDALTKLAHDISTYLNRPRKEPNKLAEFIKSNWIKILTLALAVAAFYNLDRFVTAPNVQNDPLPPARFGPISSSSYRQNTASTGAHSAASLLDGKLETAWIECRGGTPVHEGSARMERRSCNNVKDNDLLGIQESLILPLSEDTDIKALTIGNGFQISESEFYRNPRVKDVKVDLWTSTTANNDLDHPTYTLLPSKTLSDERGLQSFPTDCGKAPLLHKAGCKNVTQIRLTILSVYPGEGQPPFRIDKNGNVVMEAGQPVSIKSPASNDTAISEVQVIPATVPAHLSEVIEPRN